MASGKFIEKFQLWRVLNIPQKYLVPMLAVVVGLLSGIIASFLKKGVSWVRDILTSGFAEEHFNVLYVAYPMVGILLTLWLIKKVFRKDPGPGIPSTLYAISKRKSRLKRHNMYSSVITSILTVGFGGSVGLEAPAIQTNAAIGSNLGAQLKLDYKTKTLLIGCGAAGSMAALFGSPVAAIVLSIEVLMLDLTTASLIPLLLASISATMTSNWMYGEDVLFHFSLKDPFLYEQLPFFLLLGLFTGVFSVYFSKSYLYIKDRFKRFKNPWTRAVIGGLMLGVIIFFFPPLYGEGYEIINAFLNDNLRRVAENSFFYDHTGSIYMMLLFMACLIILKAVATSITVGAGGVGGIFAPSLFLGGTLGFFFTRVFRYFELSELSVSNFTLVGMAGVLAGVLHAPLTAIFLIAELTGGYELFIPLMLTAAISYYTSKLVLNHTIFTKELAERGELITHNKDQAVLTLMNLHDEIEKDFLTVRPEHSLRQLCVAVGRSHRNMFPVLDKNDNLIGIVTLDDIRQIMFDQSLYDEVFVHGLMTAPPEIISLQDNMETVVRKFEDSGAWNLPVVDSNQYLGFVSKSRLFSAYRSMLKNFSG